MAKTWPKGPYKKTEETLGIIESILKIDWTIEEASRYAGINPDTYYERVKNDKELSDRFKRARQYPFILARKTLMKGIQNGNDRSAIEYLKRRDDRYRDKVDNNLNMNNTDPLKAKLKKLTQDLDNKE